MMEQSTWDFSENISFRISSLIATNGSAGSPTMTALPRETVS